MARKKVLVTLETSLRNKSFETFITVLDGIPKLPIFDRTFVNFIADFALASLDNNDALFCLHSLLVRLEPSGSSATLLNLLETSCLDPLLTRCLDIPLAILNSQSNINNNNGNNNNTSEHDGAVPVLSCFRVLERLSVHSLGIKRRILDRISDIIQLIGAETLPSHILLGAAYLLNSLVQGEGKREATEDLVIALIELELKASGTILNDINSLDSITVSRFGILRHILFGSYDFLTQLILIETLFRTYLMLNSSTTQMVPFNLYLESIFGSSFPAFLALPPRHFVSQAPEFLKKLLRSQEGNNGTQGDKDEDIVRVSCISVASVIIGGTSFNSTVFATGVDSICGIIQEANKNNKDEVQKDRIRRGGLLRIPFVQCTRLQISRHDQAVVIRTTNSDDINSPPEIRNSVSTLQFWLAKVNSPKLSPPFDAVTPSVTDANYNEEPTFVGKNKSGVFRGQDMSSELTIILRFDDRTELEIFRARIAPSIIRVRSLYREQEHERLVEFQQSQSIHSKNVKGTSTTAGTIKMSMALVDPLGLTQLPSGNSQTPTQLIDPGVVVAPNTTAPGAISSPTITSAKGLDQTDTLPYAQRMTETETQNIITNIKSNTSENTKPKNNNSNNNTRTRQIRGKKRSSGTVVKENINKKSKGQKNNTFSPSSKSSSSHTPSLPLSQQESSISTSPDQINTNKKTHNSEEQIEDDKSESSPSSSSSSFPSPRPTTSKKRAQQKLSRPVTRSQTKIGVTQANKVSKNNVQGNKFKRVVEPQKSKEKTQNRKISNSSLKRKKEKSKPSSVSTETTLSPTSSPLKPDDDEKKSSSTPKTPSSPSSTRTPSSESIIEKSKSISRAKATPTATSSPIPEALKRLAQNIDPSSLANIKKGNKDHEEEMIQKAKKKENKKGPTATHEVAEENMNKRKGGLLPLARRIDINSNSSLFPQTKRAAPGISQGLQRSTSLSPSLSNPTIAIEAAFGNLQAAVANQRKRLGEASARQSLADIQEMARVFSETTASRLDALETGTRMRYEELKAQIRAESRQISAIFGDFLAAIETAQRQHENTSQDVKDFIRATGEELREAEKAQKVESTKVRKRIEQTKKRWKRRLESAEEITIGVQRMKEYIRSLDKMAELK